MATERQIAANRRNAQKSTGPRTPEGKARVRLNALKHGLSARYDVPPSAGEQEEFRSLRRGFLAELQPTGPLERLLAEQVILAAWRLGRILQLEAGYLDFRARQFSRDFRRDCRDRPASQLLAYAISRDPQVSSDALVRLPGYESRAQRSFYRALDELRSLQAQRKASPTQPPPPVFSGTCTP